MKRFLKILRNILDVNSAFEITTSMRMPSEDKRKEKDFGGG